MHVSRVQPFTVAPAVAVTTLSGEGRGQDIPSPFVRTRQRSTPCGIILAFTLRSSHWLLIPCACGSPQRHARSTGPSPSVFAYSTPRQFCPLPSPHHPSSSPLFLCFLLAPPPSHAHTLRVRVLLGLSPRFRTHVCHAHCGGGHGGGAFPGRRLCHDLHADKDCLLHCGC